MLPWAFERAVKSCEVVLASAEGWSSLRRTHSGLAVVFWISYCLVTPWESECLTLCCVGDVSGYLGLPQL